MTRKQLMEDLRRTLALIEKYHRAAVESHPQSLLDCPICVDLYNAEECVALLTELDDAVCAEEKP